PGRACPLSPIATSSQLIDLGERRELLARLMARRVSLWRAITQGELVDAARASSRTRLADLPLTPEEEAAARSARATLGRAIREARVRAMRGPGLGRPVRVLPAMPAKRWAWVWAAAAALIVLFVGWYLFVGMPAGPADQARGGSQAGRPVAVIPL